ncbi:cobalt ECF transporter T component CbiQ [Pseudonocardiaceae bacterium YIM PH 21723]|nr:cobalt ECF transporter T component CbiQ [Pseudonocardiaceae bacterium YIM PH 21723]
MSGSAHTPGADLLIPADTPVHHAQPQCKVAATLVFVFAVACTPRGVWWPYLGYALVLLAIAFYAEIPIGVLLRRLVIEVPFVLFVVLLPFLGEGPYVHGLSVPGLVSAGTILLKASFGLLATGVLAATTPLPEVITGLERLRVPRIFTAVAGFMVRYVDVLVGELARLRTARACRAGDARWLWQARDVATSVGMLFVRAFERGERVFVAMTARGYTGQLPDALTGRAAPLSTWLLSAIAPLCAASLSITAWVVHA